MVRDDSGTDTTTTTAETVEPQTTAEYDAAAGCDRQYCDRTVLADALVTVTVGTTTQQWCPQCIEDTTGMRLADLTRRPPRPTRYVTARTVAAFLLGCLLMLTIASVMVV